MEFLIVGGLIVLFLVIERNKPAPTPIQVAVMPLTSPATVPQGAVIQPAVAPITMGSDLPLPLTIAQMPVQAAPGQTIAQAQGIVNPTPAVQALPPVFVQPVMTTGPDFPAQRVTDLPMTVPYAVNPAPDVNLPMLTSVAPGGPMPNTPADVLIMTNSTGSLTYQKPNGDTYTVWPQQPQPVQQSAMIARPSMLDLA